MTKEQFIASEAIELDPGELLGLRQVAKVSGMRGKPDDLARLLSKVGANEEVIINPPPTGAFSD